MFCERDVKITGVIYVWSQPHRIEIRWSRKKCNQKYNSPHAFKRLSWRLWSILVIPQWKKFTVSGENYPYRIHRLKEPFCQQLSSFISVHNLILGRYALKRRLWKVILAVRTCSYCLALCLDCCMEIMVSSIPLVYNGNRFLRFLY